MKTSQGMQRGKKRSGSPGQGLLPYMQGKLAVTGLVIMLALFALMFRLWKIQHDNNEAYNQKVLSQQRYDSREIPYRRGDIVDRNGTMLATTNKVYNLILDPKQINDAQETTLEPTVDLLVQEFGYDRQELYRLFEERSTSRYVRKERNLSHEKKEAFEEARKNANDTFRKEGSPNRIAGVWFEDAYLRTYPYGALGCNVIGFATGDGADGSGGIEQYYNSDLIGISGREYGYLNDESNLERVIKPASDGKTIVSTIDVKVQNTIEQCIAQFEAEMGGNTTAVLVMDPNTGEILGMSTNRRFDLNNPQDLTPYFPPEMLDAMSQEEKMDACYQLWRNFCVSDSYEPGSTSKVITVAAGLEDGVVHPDDTYTCEGVLEVGGWPIHCNKRTGHGVLTTAETLMQSCNVAMMRMSQRLGKENFSRAQHLFGFGSKTGIDLPGEADTSALVFTPQQMVSSDLATNSFGQNYNCTMIQMAAAISSAINGGSYYQPHVVRQILNAQGAVVRDIQPQLVRETVSADTSAFLRTALFRTVAEGTGKAAGVEGYTIGGKTGTAEKYPRKNGNYLVSFCGFAPAENPQVLCYVVVDTPHTADQPHSTFASGIFHNVMQEILPYLNVFPAAPEGEEEDPFQYIPLNEGINDGTATGPVEEARPQVVYDTEEYAEPGSPEGEALPGEPAGQEESPEEAAAKASQAAAEEAAARAAAESEAQAAAEAAAAAAAEAAAAEAQAAEAAAAAQAGQ